MNAVDGIGIGHLHFPHSATFNALPFCLKDGSNFYVFRGQFSATPFASIHSQIPTKNLHSPVPFSHQFIHANSFSKIECRAPFSLGQIWALMVIPNFHFSRSSLGPFILKPQPRAIYVLDDHFYAIPI